MKSTDLYRVALTRSKITYFRYISQVFQIVYDTMVTDYAWNICSVLKFIDSDRFQIVSSLQNAKKMEDKRKTPDQASSLMLKGGVEGHGQNRSKWPKILAGTLFQHFITDSPSGWGSIKVGWFWPPLLYTFVSQIQGLQSHLTQKEPMLCKNKSTFQFDFFLS